MFHSVRENLLYDFLNKQEIKIELFKDKEKFDICQFLDDISVWMDHNREFISDKYLPLAVLAIGIYPPNVGAFLYGMFVGKTLTKQGVDVKATKRTITPNEIQKIIEEDLGSTQGIFGDFFKPGSEGKDGKK